eukprot:145573-Chlamydomonas_euryale.AAC.13
MKVDGAGGKASLLPPVPLLTEIVGANSSQGNFQLAAFPPPSSCPAFLLHPPPSPPARSVPPSRQERACNTPPTPAPPLKQEPQRCHLSAATSASPPQRHRLSAHLDKRHVLPSALPPRRDDGVGVGHRVRNADATRRQQPARLERVEQPQVVDGVAEHAQRAVSAAGCEERRGKGCGAGR